MALRVNDIVVSTSCIMAGDRELTPQMILGPKRHRRIAVPRMICMYLVRKHFRYSLPMIGRLFHRDHTTVLSGWRRINQKYQVDPVFWAQLEQRIMINAQEIAQKRDVKSVDIVAQNATIVKTQKGGSHEALAAA